MDSTNFSQPPHDPLFLLGRAILFELDPEKAHDLTLRLLARKPVRSLIARRYRSQSSVVSCMGQNFSNRIGLAAGMDKNGDYIDALGAIGFGHLEIGTVTPRPQSGNTQPRLFRLQQHEALINRFGFNNKGVDHLVAQVRNCRYKGRIGVNIGKNASTALDQANEDYLYCLQRVYPHTDYVTINISSPNTSGLRDLQHGKRLSALLEAVKNAQSKLSTEHERYVPIAVKIAPDMTDSELDDFCEQLIEHEIDAAIVSNTTSARSAVSGHIYARESGGLSGAPLKTLADDRLRAVAQRIGNKAALIGAGGVSCGADAQTKLSLGASLVQLYSGLIFHGPALVRDCIESTND